MYTARKRRVAILYHSIEHVESTLGSTINATYAQTSFKINVVPRVLSLLREITLVAAGHVDMCDNELRSGGWFRH